MDNDDKKLMAFVAYLLASFLLSAFGCALYQILWPVEEERMADNPENPIPAE